MPVAIQSNGTYSQQIDLRDSEKGKYTITVASNDGSTVFLEEEIYADSALEGDKLTGIVGIEYNDSTNELYGATEEYRISFKRLTSIWKYFIVNKSGNLDYGAEVISINDAGSANGSPYEANTFSRAYASILLTADTAGPGGNSISLSYSGTGTPPALLLSGPTLSGGEGTTAATGVVTIINNDLEEYTLSIGGVDFEEGDQFSKGPTAADTASNLISAITANLSVQAGASIQDYDVLINEAPTLVFASNELIPFYESPKLNLELRNDTDVQTIVPHLSNPSPAGKLKEYADKTESEIYVFI
jgi:hypothetical protein